MPDALAEQDEAEASASERVPSRPRQYTSRVCEPTVPHSCAVVGELLLLAGAEQRDQGPTTSSGCLAALAGSHPRAEKHALVSCGAGIPAARQSALLGVIELIAAEPGDKSSRANCLGAADFTSSLSSQVSRSGTCPAPHDDEQLPASSTRLDPASGTTRSEREQERLGAPCTASGSRSCRATRTFPDPPDPARSCVAVTLMLSSVPSAEVSALNEPTALSWSLVARLHCATNGASEAVSNDSL
mmetsp:Transcript_2151/g.8316  ORF Transcript_2151/g.8316 Transcript_2151/m.8316 type:complete len:244 (+) Transcript_2151:2163-2894(+)